MRVGVKKCIWSWTDSAEYRWLRKLYDITQNQNIGQSQGQQLAVSVLFSSKALTQSLFFIKYSRSTLHDASSRGGYTPTMSTRMRKWIASWTLSAKLGNGVCRFTELVEIIICFNYLKLAATFAARLRAFHQMNRVNWILSCASCQTNIELCELSNLYWAVRAVKLLVSRTQGSLTLYQGYTSDLKKAVWHSFFIFTDWNLSWYFNLLFYEPRRSWKRRNSSNGISLKTTHTQENASISRPPKRKDARDPHRASWLHRHSNLTRCSE